MLDTATQSRALRWVEGIVGSHVSSFQELVGGLTSTMLAITDETGRQCVLRLMTHEPWRAHGSALTSRERDAQRELSATSVPAPVSLGLDAEGTNTGVSAHLMYLSVPWPKCW